MKPPRLVVTAVGPAPRRACFGCVCRSGRQDRPPGPTDEKPGSNTGRGSTAGQTRTPCKRNATPRRAIVQTHAADLSQPQAALKIGSFDRILLDAPCSGLGVMRRNPDIKWVLSKKNLTYYNTRQFKLLKRLAPLVKPSGVLVYAVCSMEPEENEAVVQAFLHDHPEFSLAPTPLAPEIAGQQADRCPRLF